MYNNWHTVYITNNLIEAELIKAFLKENGINVVIVNKQDSFYKIGNIYINVKESDFLLSKTLINKYQSLKK